MVVVSLAGVQCGDSTLQKWQSRGNFHATLL